MAPKWMCIGGSCLHGTTVSTRIDIPQDHVICRTSIENLNRAEGHIETPDGNLFHHSHDVKEINCKLEIINDEFIEVIAKRDIKITEELLINYDNNPFKRYDFHNYSIH
jgi:hypothetical protein